MKSHLRHRCALGTLPVLLLFAACDGDTPIAPGGNDPPPPAPVTWDRVQGGIGVDTFLGVTGLSDGSFYAVHEGGVLRFLNGEWTRENVPAGAPLRAVWGSSRTRAFAVGDDGRIVVRGSNGWTDAVTSTSADLLDVSGNANTVIVTGDDGGAGVVLRLSGSAWDVVPSSFSVPLATVWVASDGRFVVAGNNTYARYDGSNWDPHVLLNDEDILDSWGVSYDDFYLAGSGGLIVHVAPGVVETISTGVTHAFHSVWGSSATDVRVAGDAGDLRVFNGTAWSVATTRVDVDLLGITGASPAYALAVGSEGTVLGGYGQLWMPLYRGAPYVLEGVWSDGFNYIAAGTREDGTGIATDGFDTWNFPEAQHAASGFLGDGVYVMGDGGVIRRYNGGDWIPEPVVTTSALRAATGLRTRFGEPFRLYVVGDDGTLLVWRDGTWENATLPAGAENFDFVDVWAAATDDVFAVASNSSSVVRYDDPTENGPWTLQATPATGNLLGIGGIELTTFAVSDLGEIIHHDGQSWELLQSPVTTPLHDVRIIARDAGFAVGDNGVALFYDGSVWRPSTLDYLGDLRSVHGWAGERVFTVGTQGGVFRTTP